MKTKKSLYDCLKEIMLSGNEYTPYELQEILKCEYQRFHSDGSICRRLREMRDEGLDLKWRFSHKGSWTTYYWVVV